MCFRVVVKHQSEDENDESEQRAEHDGRRPCPLLPILELKIVRTLLTSLGGARGVGEAGQLRVAVPRSSVSRASARADRVPACNMFSGIQTSSRTHWAQASMEPCGSRMSPALAPSRSSALISRSRVLNDQPSSAVGGDSRTQPSWIRNSSLCRSSVLILTHVSASVLTVVASASSTASQLAVTVAANGCITDTSSSSFDPTNL